MAIKVNGTTVIDDSRNLSNVGGLKTINGESILGSGDISAGGGASTTYGDVGTYGLLYYQGGVDSFVEDGVTYAGSGLRPAGFWADPGSDDGGDQSYLTMGGSSLSGTWRAMGRSKGFSSVNNQGRVTLFVRIS